MIVGIDLGTTNSLVAFINKEGKPEIVINERGSRITPSVVYFKNDREVLVGELARSQMILKADRTVSAIKRQMGTAYKVSIGEHDYTPPEISALILRKLVQYTEKYLGRKVEAAVVTVPAYFNDNQRQATFLAGELAGLKILKLLNEPTAAALAYGARWQQQEKVLVLDIGGGTFDITLMECQEGEYRVLCTGGSTSLGGIDFDRRLMQHVLDTFKETAGIDIGGDKVALQQLELQAEKVKIDLSTVSECSLLIPYITLGPQGPVHLNQVIRRDQFEHLCRDLFEEIRSLIQQTLRKARISSEEVDAVVLAGGASRMPGFQEVVAEIFGRHKMRGEINPDEVVALGAAIEGGMLSGELENVNFYDATSHSLGVEDDQGNFVPLIPANTSYPVARSCLFTTVRDGQEEVIIHVLQRDELAEEGEPRKYISLGLFHLGGIKNAPAGEPNIDVTFAIDRSGILRVAAADLDTGTQKEVEITEVAYGDGRKLVSSPVKEFTVL